MFVGGWRVGDYRNPVLSKNAYTVKQQNCQPKPFLPL
jgi:hypothetical protein